MVSRNWRPLVFGLVFLLVAVSGLAYNYSRPAEYRVGARLEIIPAEKPPGDANSSAAPVSDASAFLTETQLLTARETLEEVVKRLHRAGLDDSPSAGDPVLALQKMISVIPLQGTPVVELWAVGAKPEVLPYALNELIHTYQLNLSKRFVGSSQEAVNQAREEAAKYETAVLQKRREVEAFRTQHGIVSQEREENEPIARAKGLSTALNTAEEKAVTTQSRLRSLKAAVTEGKAAVFSKDNPVLANLEQQLSQARGELNQLEKRYTRAYLMRDPQAAALINKIPELEDQIKREREASLRANLAEAEQEAAQAQAALDRLKSRLTTETQSVQTFAAHLGEFKALQTQLDNLEKLQRSAAERRVRIEAQEDARKPQVRVIQSASAPGAPWRPNYTRDAAITLAAALALGWLAAWLTDFLIGHEKGPTVIVASAPLAYPMNLPELMPGPAPILTTAAPMTQLPSPQPILRELDNSELTALLDAANDQSRLALISLLSGVEPEELIELTWSDFDLDTRSIRIARPAARQIAMEPEVAKLFAMIKRQNHVQPGDGLLSAPTATPVSLNHLEALVSYAAHDANLAQAAEVTPGLIRHTFIAFLVRQGIRFSELTRIVGPLTAAVTAAYGAMVSSGVKRRLDETDRVIPALRELAKSIDGGSNQS